MPDSKEPYARLSGKIVETELKLNEWTGQKFWWALVQTHYGLFDVVADLNMINTSSKPDCFLSGDFWLSGRIVDGDHEHRHRYVKPGFFRSLFRF
jgi:hypothetical protein